VLSLLLESELSMRRPRCMGDEEEITQGVSLEGGFSSFDPHGLIPAKRERERGEA